jgi:orotate phosphoribosyltransferase
MINRKFKKKMRHIAEILLKTNAVKLSINPPFTWTSGIKSPCYCDNRILISFPEYRDQIVKSFIEMINSLEVKIDVIAGTATAGIPWASFIAMEMNLPMVFVRSKPKEHGTKKQIEGVIEDGQNVLIIEDLISTGKSSIVAVNAVKLESGGNVIGVMAIMDWQMQIAQDNFKNANTNYWTLANFSELIPLAVEKDYIQKQDQDIILSFKNDPQAWDKNLKN